MLKCARGMVYKCCVFNYRGNYDEKDSHSIEDVKLEFDSDVQMDNSMPPMPQFVRKSVSGINCSIEVYFGEARGVYSCLGFVVKFQRRYHYFIWQVYLPSGILVAISWLSFWIDVNAIPGRVALVTTTLLTLATQFSTIQKSLPPVSYLKAIDVWMLACVIFVFLSLVEFVSALTWEKRQGRVQKPTTKTMMKVPRNVRRVFPTPDADSKGLWRPSLIRPLPAVGTLGKRNGKGEKATHVETPTLPAVEIQINHENVVDRVAKFVFFLLFLIFNVVYWCVYLA